MGQGSKKDGCKPATGHYKGDRITAGEHLWAMASLTRRPTKGTDTRQNHALSISAPGLPDFECTNQSKMP